MYASLQDRIVVITGVTGGLGPAVVERFHNEGAQLVLVDRAADRLQSLYGDQPRTHSVMGIDLTKAESVDEMATRIAAQHNHVDGLINIAGGYRAGEPVHETTVDTWDYMMNLNAKSVFLTSRAIVPMMLKAGRGGFILSIGARNGVEGRANSVAYGASKAAVFRITQSLSKELAEHQIRVNAVYPRLIDTKGSGKGVAPSSIAAILAFLASNEARDITGALIPIPGV